MAPNADTTKVDDLSRNLKSTAASRFNAARRLETRDRTLTRLTAFTSAYVVVLSVLPYFRHLESESTDWINLFVVGCTIVVLVSSLLQYSGNDIVNAEQHHRSGLEIAELRREMKVLSGHITDSDLMEYTRRYNLILQKYSVNHDDIDYDKYRLDGKIDLPNFSTVNRGITIVKIILYKYIPSITLLVVTLAVGAVLVRYAVPWPPLVER